MSDHSTAPIVGVVMGSDSDLPVMRAALDALDEFGVPREVRILSAHRTPDDMLRYAHDAAKRGLKVIIAGAGGAAHLPGMIASATPLPVVGVPVPTTQLAGVDALLSIAQMPAGVPVATVAIGNARNAGLLAVRILATADADLREAMERFQAELADLVRERDAKIQGEAVHARNQPNDRV
jgi:5-(carboxyamino)imidazole ribonucleotide mutase